MTTLTINDLSLTESLGRSAMAAIFGGKHQEPRPEPRGNAFGLRGREGLLGGLRFSSTQTTQQALSIINITGDNAVVTLN